ncbi:putative metallo-beta-lactamase domain protein [Exophiala viscosa]|uniref:putative metallo-beta-lactamase domain protein n=1 Tax=Exophiala viscosa TaxID=2486360 RepID=UPI002190188E|nr:putative metallo-beta-lactamase domain protein [Exophiala viscosa]
MYYDPYLSPISTMPLHASVYVSPSIPWSLPNGQPGGPWSPISSTLIHTDTQAVLVDTPITQSQTADLASWIERTLPATASLSYIYITHGHGDHWFGTNALLQRFPGARVVATKDTIAHMQSQIEPRIFKAMWSSRFPGQIDTSFHLAEPLPESGEFCIDDKDTSYKMKAIEVGHADTHSSTVLWCEDLRLVVAGDVVYGDVHQMLGEANTHALRLEWVAAIDKVASLNPMTVVAGHKKPDEIDGVWHLARSKQYILDFDKLVESGECKTVRDLVARMKSLWSTRFNDGALVVGAINALKVKKKGGSGKL